MPPGLLPSDDRVAALSCDTRQILTESGHLGHITDAKLLIGGWVTTIPMRPMDLVKWSVGRRFSFTYNLWRGGYTVYYTRVLTVCPEPPWLPNGSI